MLLQGVFVGLAACLALVWMIPLVADVGSLLRAASGERRGTRRRAKRRQRLLVIVPAHDEEGQIGACIRSLCSMTRAVSRHTIIVLADACSDDTVGVAERAGATVLAHRDSAPLGKTRLLEWALPRLPLGDHDALVVVDADSVVDPAFCDAFASEGTLRDRVLQANLAVLSPTETWLTRLGELLNAARYEGQWVIKRAAGINAPLTGNGMCIGTDVLRRYGLGCQTIKEDLELYARYTVLGVVIRYVPDARIRSLEPHTLQDARTQRQRWQLGRWQVCRRYLPSVVTAKRPLHQRIDAVGELTSIGPVLHASLATPLALVLFVTGGGISNAIGVMLLLGLVPCIAWTALALIRRPDRLRLAIALMMLPAYAGWRVLVALTSLVGAEKRRWNRSPRPGPAE